MTPKLDKNVQAADAKRSDRQASGEMRGVEIRAPGALYHSGTDDDTYIGYHYDLRKAGVAR